MSKLKEGTFLIVLDVKGEKKTSEGFANALQACFTSGKSNITFVIGGSPGTLLLIGCYNIRVHLVGLLEGVYPFYRFWVSIHEGIGVVVFGIADKGA